MPASDIVSDPATDVHVAAGHHPAMPTTPPDRRHRRTDIPVVVAIGCGGVLGAVGRYAISLLLPTHAGGFPWSTFAVNISGSATLGLLLVVIAERLPRGHLARPMLGTGLIGAYTTFSTFTVEAVLMTRDGHLSGAIVYVLSSVLAGLGAVAVGMTSARALLHIETRSENAGRNPGRETR